MSQVVLGGGDRGAEVADRHVDTVEHEGLEHALVGHSRGDVGAPRKVADAELHELPQEQGATVGNAYGPLSW